jgi:two-component system cell cycle sensor histidine kinase/response regulator CckA
VTGVPSAPSAPRRPERRGVARIRPLYPALAVGLLAVLVSVLGARWTLQLREDLRRERVSREVNSVGTALESVIAHRMAVLHGLASFLSLQWGTPDLPSRFASFVDGLMAGTPGIRTMQYVRDGVIQHTWPFEGNAEALGQNLADDSRVEIAEDFRLTLASRSIIISGPLELFQGGVGIVGRLAVRDHRDSVVAVAGIVVEFETLINESGLTRSAEALAVRLVNHSDSVLWSSGRPDGDFIDPARASVSLPDRTWLVEAVPIGGWGPGEASWLRTYWTVAGSGIILVSLLAWLVQAWLHARINASHLEELRRAEDTFQKLFHLVPDGVVVSRAADGVVLEVNSAYCRMVQRPREELIGKSIPELGVWGSLEEREIALHTLATERVLSEFPYLLRRSDGTDREAILSARVVELHGETCHLAVVRDVHDRVRLERRLAQGQRLEAVGRLAGGIAHDFNNLITGIRGYADLLLDTLPADDPRRNDLGEILRASSRAADLTRQLLTFARRQVVTPRLVDLNQIVTEVEPMLRRLSGEKCQLVTRLAPQTVPVVVDPAQFEQVLTNLTVNARDAMKDGGTIELGTAVEGDCAVLSVEDTGVGIPAGALPHIFEPFYTTKPDGQGTGLGLATVYGIVEQAEGRIDVRSEVGQGTVFRILLPTSPDEAVTDLSESEPGQDLPRGTEVVLVVDDEPQVRDLCVRLLHRLGYHASAAPDGHAALAALAASPDVALVLTDLVMPGMGGTELVEILRGRYPNLKLMMMSGYSAELVASGQEGIPFLAKPFTVHELAQAVRETLDA